LDCVRSPTNLATINIVGPASLNGTALIRFLDTERLNALLAALLTVDLAAENHTLAILHNIWLGTSLALIVGINTAWFGGLALPVLIDDEALAAFLALSSGAVDGVANCIILGTDTASSYAVAGLAVKTDALSGGLAVLDTAGLVVGDVLDVGS
jgi:hypothetical protein